MRKVEQLLNWVQSHHSEKCETIDIDTKLLLQSISSHKIIEIFNSNDKWKDPFFYILRRNWQNIRINCLSILWINFDFLFTLCESVTFPLSAERRLSSVAAQFLKRCKRICKSIHLMRKFYLCNDHVMNLNGNEYHDDTYFVGEVFEFSYSIVQS